LIGDWSAAMALPVKPPTLPSGPGSTEALVRFQRCPGLAIRSIKKERRR